MLPACGHTACEGCLNALHRRNCPFCRKVIKVPISELPRNLALISLLDQGAVQIPLAQLAGWLLEPLDELKDLDGRVKTELLARAQRIEEEQMESIAQMRAEVEACQEAARAFHKDIDQLRRELRQKVEAFHACNRRRDSLEGRCAIKEHLLRRELRALHAPCAVLDALVVQRRQRRCCEACGTVFRSEVKCLRHLQFSPACTARSGPAAAAAAAGEGEGEGPAALPFLLACCMPPY
eukprot:EG_transcript_20172